MTHNDSEIFRLNQRVLPDGAYFIHSKISRNRLFCIKDQKLDEGIDLLNGRPTSNAHQTFILKYQDKNGFYLIMALHSHKFLGIKKSNDKDADYSLSLIHQYSYNSNYLLDWSINLIEKSCYTFELMGTNLFLELDNKTNKLQLNKKSYNDSSIFIIKTFQILRNGLYYISGEYNKNFLSFPASSTHTLATFTSANKDRHLIFYLQFDDKDGCYSISNFYTLECLSTYKSSNVNSLFYQNFFENYDNQKFIISAFDVTKGNFFIELKSNQLRLSIANYSSDSGYPLILSQYKPNFKESKNQFFNFYAANEDKYKSFYDKAVKHVTDKQELTYVENIKIEDHVNEIGSDILINSYFIKLLSIPYTVRSISNDAFINLRMVRTIECDPKWLKLFPNPLYVNQIKIIEKVKVINEDDFENFNNLEFLSLPSSLIKVAPKSFENINNLRIFRGNLKFINLINTTSLLEVTIPSYIRTIPKEAFAGSVNLRKVIFDEKSKLEVIESRAFANCISMDPFDMPATVKNIAPDAFLGCHKKNIPTINQESQKLSMLDNLIIDSHVTIITEDYSACFNIESLEIPMSVAEIDDGVFNNFKRLKYIKCDPKWLKYFPNSQIEIVFIPQEIQNIYKVDFENLTSLSFIEIPSSVETIEENAFDSCINLTSYKCGTKHLPFLNQEKIKSLIFNNEIKSIDQSIFDPLVNLESLVLPDKILIKDKTIFKNCKKLVQINKPNAEELLNNKAYIEEGITKIEKKDFEDWTNLSLLCIPSSVNEIEPDAFENCLNLSNLICDPKFFSSFSKNSIKNVIIPDFVTELKKGQFDSLIFLTNLKLPENIKIDDPSIFDLCSNLTNITASPSTIEFLSEKTRERCIKKVVKIDYVKPNYNFNSKYLLTNNDDEDETLDQSQEEANISTEKSDEKESLDQSKEETNKSSEKNNGNEKLDQSKEEDITNSNKNEINDIETSIDEDLPFVEDKSDDEIVSFKNKKSKNQTNKNDIINITLSSEEENGIKSTQSTKRPKETTIDDLAAYDPNNKKYSRYIIEVQTNIVEKIIPKSYMPKSTDLSEISKVCGAVCSEINITFKIIPRPVQILVVLRLADNILNNNNSHGAIGEIKTGEGKSLIVTILSIVLVKFNRKVDVVSSNLELVKRDQSESEPYFQRFGIKTGVLYNKRSDYEFYKTSKETFSNSIQEQKQYGGYNVNVLDYPVVFSNNSNFEHLYLHSIFNLYPRKRQYDVVLVDEVDNMFIDDSRSSSRVAYNIDYAYSNDILEIVFLLQALDTNDIIKFLEYYFPQVGIFEIDAIEMLKDAAIRACQLKKKVDYIIEDNEIVIIDSNTGFKKPKCRWSDFLHEMIEIKEGFKPKQTCVEICLITQKGYFNLYRKIVGVTGTIGSPGDEDILKEGYNVELFRLPRHFESQMKEFIKNRPSKISQLYKEVCDEIIQERNKGRPVLVIWDSIFNAEEFSNQKSFLLAQKILGVNPDIDRKSIKKAGKAETVTIATSAAGRGVDIKLSKESIEAGGLHVIIPMKMPNQRALEQAAGRAGRQGQPGSVTFYVSEEDRFIKQQPFKKGDDNLIRLELKFSDFLRKNYPWMLLAPRLYSFINIVFPFNSSPSDVINILVRYIAFIMKGNIFEKENKRIQDLSLEIVQLSWGVFFTALCGNIDGCEDWDAINDLYEDYIASLMNWFPPNICTSADRAVWHIRGQLIKELDWEYIIVKGIKITAAGLCIICPAAAPFIIIGSDLILTGGLEIYHQLQNGEKINWVQVLIRCGGSLTRNAIFVAFGINSRFLNMSLYFAEQKLYNMAATENLEMDEDNFYEDDELALELSNSVHLSKNINGTSQNTNRWLCRNIKNKKKPKNLIKFKPKYYSPILNIDFIRMSMRFALDAYTGKFRIGKTILISEENDLYKPKFYCVEDCDNIYVVTRGSDALIDWVTDFICIEVHQKIDGKDIYFHKGFYNAANYVLGKIMDILKHTKKPVYFIGHSYAGAVSTILTLLTKSDPEFKDKTIYGIVFAPPPAISYCPAKISDCIFAFINRYDFVTSFSLFNLCNTAAKNHCATKVIVRRCLKTLKSIKMEWVKYLIYAVEQNFEQITSNHEILNVRKVKGKVYRIGIERKKRLSEYRINDSQLPNTLYMELTSLVDHMMPEYIKSFKIVQF